jgi:hypothetical protein
VSVSGWKRAVVALQLIAALFWCGVLLLQYGVYGWTVFVIAPVCLGGIVAWAVRADNVWIAAGVGALAVGGATCLLLLLGMEGLWCVLVALPIMMPMGALGGWLAYALGSAWVSSRGVTALLLIPLGSFTWDKTAAPAVFEVRTQMMIEATPEQVWKDVIQFTDLPDPHEWYFRTGLAYPQRARISGTGAGAVRTCDFSTGPVVERIEVWDEPRLLRFRVIENPAPLVEWGLWAKIAPKHLHGYLIGKWGEFRLTPLGGGRTLVEATSSYQHGLWPAGYWRWWSDAIFRRIHARVLKHIRALAERDGAADRELAARF